MNAERLNVVLVKSGMSVNRTISMLNELFPVVLTGKGIYISKNRRYSGRESKARVGLTREREANPGYMDVKNMTKCVFMTTKSNVNTKVCPPWHLDLGNPCRDDALFRYLCLTGK